MMKEICKAIRRIASPDNMMKFFDEVFYPVSTMLM